MEKTSSLNPRQLALRRGDYGFDAPYVPIMFILVGVAVLVIGLLSLFLWQALIWGILCVLYGVYMLLAGASYIYTTRRGKFQVWAELLSGLKLRGDEQVLDMGCGRGAVLLMAAALVPQGKVTGVDIWRTGDQSGNADSTTQKNAELEGVAEKIELHTADMRQLPFADNSFDLILSSAAIHNIPNRAGRLKALDEAVRVLKPGGRLLIADLNETRHYAEHLRALGMASVTHQLQDWRFWYGAPWVMTRLVTAIKPTS
ncbi:MAG TPA: methyltransferase domain-containing protein [Ktedonobacteraceae bacterium]|nr:methyltransferase domain-containing protein [Ktedonobacteraceae bacterium]